MSYKEKCFYKVLNDLDASISSTINGKKQFTTIIALTKDNSIPFVHISESNRSWELPGGTIETGESVIDASIREYKEETGLTLLNPVEVLTIKNIDSNNNKIESLVAVVVGLTDISRNQKIDDPEIAELKFFHSTPLDSTFGKEYVDYLIDIAIGIYAIEVNERMWNQAVLSYESQTVMSEDDIHYGPLIPGETELKLLPNLEGKTILELGCGSGHNLSAFGKMGVAKGYGIDFSTEQLELAKTRIPPHFILKLGDFSNPNTITWDNYFDVVLSVFALSFVSDIDTVFTNVYKALKFGGYFVFSTDHPNRVFEGCKNISNLRYWKINSDITNEIPYIHYLHSYTKLCKAIINAGFEIESIIEPNLVPKEKLKDSPYYSMYFENRYQVLPPSHSVIQKALYNVTQARVMSGKRHSKMSRKQKLPGKQKR